MISGQEVTAFTNSEENAIKLMEAMPFPLETKLVENGAKFSYVKDWGCNVVVSGRIITGHNPASATKMAEEVVKKLTQWFSIPLGIVIVNSVFLILHRSTLNFG